MYRSFLFNEREYPLPTGDCGLLHRFERYVLQVVFEALTRRG